MAIPSSSLLPFTQYPWHISENTLEVFVIIGLMLVLMGLFLYRSWRAFEQTVGNAIQSPISNETELQWDHFIGLQKHLKEVSITHKDQLKGLTLQVIKLKTGSNVNPKVPARQQILPTSAKNILIDLERIMYDKITTESDLEEFRTRLLKYFN